MRRPGSAVSTHSPSVDVMVWLDGVATRASRASRTPGDGSSPRALAAISTLAS